MSEPTLSYPLRKYERIRHTLVQSCVDAELDFEFAVGRYPRDSIAVHVAQDELDARYDALHALDDGAGALSLADQWVVEEVGS